MERPEEPRGRQGRHSVGLGAALIILGLILLAARWLPGLDLWSDPGRSWPLFFVLAGVIVAVAGLGSGSSASAIPAVFLAGLGVILHWQQATGDRRFWSWAWTLLPALTGLGLIVKGLLDLPSRRRTAAGAITRGMRSVAASAILLGLLGPFLGAPLQLARYWPAGLILLGLLLLLRPRRRHGR
ncbi:MAG: hypothetical protein K6U08_04660 [Firmicutes bacterium]|nr:hypothetical protein [Bacillota bacterium]